MHGAVAGALINTGQDCTAATRAYVQRPLYDAFVAGVADLMGTVVLGEPFDERTDQGPLVSRRPAGAGGRLRRPGPRRRGEGRERRCRAGWRRWRAAPTTSRRWSSTPPRTPRSCRTRSSARCWSCCPSTATTRGSRLANDTPYGLAASAWTRDVFRALRATREIRAGCVWVNDHIPIISEMPHGGYKDSGFGKDMSSTRWRSTPTVKHVMYDGTAAVRKDWHRTVFTGPEPATTSRGAREPTMSDIRQDPRFRAIVRSQLSRRSLMRGAGGVGVAAALAACGTGGDDASRASPSRRPGQVRHRQGRPLGELAGVPRLRRGRPRSTRPWSKFQEAVGHQGDLRRGHRRQRLATTARSRVSSRTVTTSARTSSCSPTGWPAG